MNYFGNCRTCGEVHLVNEVHQCMSCEIIEAQLAIALEKERENGPPSNVVIPEDRGGEPNEVHR